jgi:hypothetical protein
MKYQCKQGHIFLFPETIHTGSEFNWGEYKKCPECDSIYLTEYVEPEADITSVLSCDLGAVDGFLKQGYIVKELYAKTTTLIKREVKKEQPDPDDNQAITESNDVTDPFVLQARAYYAKLHPEVKTE